MEFSVLSGAAVASIAGAALSLDRTAAFQSMASRPMVAAPVVGYLLGAALAGLAAGVLLELVFIGDLPVGGHVPVHETALAVFVTAVSSAFMASHGFEPEDLMAALSSVTMSVLAGIPVGVFYHAADEKVRAFNVRFHRRAEAAVAAGGGGLMLDNLMGAASFFAVNAAALFVTLLPAMFAAAVVPDGLSLRAARAVYPAFAGLLVLGAAAAFNAAGGSRHYALFAAFGIGAALLTAFIL